MTSHDLPSLRFGCLWDSKLEPKCNRTRNSSATAQETAVQPDKRHQCTLAKISCTINENYMALLQSFPKHKTNTSSTYKPLHPANIYFTTLYNLKLDVFYLVINVISCPG